MQPIISGTHNPRLSDGKRSNRWLRRIGLALSLAAGPSLGHAQQITFQGETDGAQIADAASATTPGTVHEWRFPVTALTGSLTHVQVQLVVQHPAVGDLSLVLIAPNGARLVLAAQVGALRNGSASFADLNGNYLFDDGGADLWEAAAGMDSGTVPEGVFYRTSTEGRRSTGGCPTWLDVVFGGMPPAASNGIWRVQTRDHRPGDTGGYLNAVLRLTQSLPPVDPIFAASFEDGDLPEAPRSSAAVPTATTGAPTCRRAPAYDLDGDGFSEFVVARPTVTTNGDALTWIYRRNDNGSSIGPDLQFQLGRPGDQFAAGDYDGDGMWDAAVFRPGNPGLYLIRPSSNPATTRNVFYGSNGDARNVGDYDGDGVYDFAQYNVGSGPSSNGNVVVRSARTGVERAIAISVFYTSKVIGGPDYTGDGVGDLVQRIADVSQVRDGVTSVLGPPIVSGQDADVLLPGQFSGDERADVATTGAALNFPELRRWEGVASGSSASFSATFAKFADLPAPGDYDGDGIDDYAVWELLQGDTGRLRYLRSSNGNESTSLIGRFGDSVPAAARVH